MTYKRNGYVMLNIPDHHRASTDGYVYEHVVLAEKYIGRSLKPEEVVHHENEIKDDNSIENLKIFRTSSDHTRYHNTGIKVMMDDGTYIAPEIKRLLSCEQCGSTFEFKSKRSKYCSQKCSKIARRVVERPSKDKLEELINEFSFVAIGRMFNVSDNSIRKWAKSYGII